MVDYSRWNRIEISDDEDDTHPNIDTGSLFRWRHQARLERMEKHRQTKMDIEGRLQEIEKKLSEFNHNDDDDSDNVIETMKKKFSDRKKMNIFLPSKKATTMKTILLFFNHLN